MNADMEKYQGLDKIFDWYNEDKIINAVGKSAKRSLQVLTDEDYSLICEKVFEEIKIKLDKNSSLRIKLIILG